MELILLNKKESRQALILLSLIVIVFVLFEPRFNNS